MEEHNEEHKEKSDEEYKEQPNEEEPLKEQEKKGGKFKVNKRIILWVIVAILAIAVIYVVFFRNNATVGQAIASAGQAARSSSSGMVGGC